MDFLGYARFAPMPTRNSKVAVLALIAKCGVIRLLKLIACMASRV